MFFSKQMQAMKPVRNHSRSRKGAAHSLFRPRLEVLEDRCVPSAVNIWVSTANIFWNTPSNWSLGHVPTSNDIAYFDSHSATPCLIDAPAVGPNTVSGIIITFQYTGTVSLVANLTLGTDGFAQDTGTTFLAGSNTTIMNAGRWLEANSLGFQAGSSTVDFNGANTQLLDSGGSAFFNVTHSGSGLLQLLNHDLTVKNYLTNSADTLDVNDHNLTVGSSTTITDSYVINSGNSATEVMNLGGGLNISAGSLGSGLGVISLLGGVYAYSNMNRIPMIEGKLDLNGVSQTFNVHPGAFDVEAVVTDGGIIKAGQGTMWLAAQNTYSGITTVNEGILQVLGPGTLLNSPITINSGLLDGTGTVGAVTVGSSGVLLAGDYSTNTPGILSTGSLQFNYGGVLDVIVNGLAAGTGYSQLRVNGTVNLTGVGGSAGFLMLGTWRPHSGDKFDFIENQGASPISGNIYNAPEGTIETYPQYGRILFTYKGGTGNDFVITSVPIIDLAGRVSSSGEWWVGQPNGAAFNTVLGTTWSPAVTWVDVQTGDFTGDGRQDLIGRVLQTGEWWVSVSNGVGGFTTSLWSTWSPAVTWVDVKVGDFNADGKADIIGRELDNGQWWVGQSTGTSFTTSLWATWSPAVTWADVKVGDFTGNGKADIIGRVLENGQWWVGTSSGSSFNTSLWATWSPAVTWVDVNVGDFKGDGKADIVGRDLQSGQWWVGLSNGFSFTTSWWDTWSPAVTWVDVKVGDFNGLGRDSIVGRVLETGQWWVGQSTTFSFNTSLWATWSPAVTWVDVQVGDFTGTGKADITGRIKENGQWWTGVSNGAAFNTSLWSTWSPAVSWVDVHADHFS